MCAAINTSNYHSITLKQRYDLSLLQRNATQRYPFLLETNNQNNLSVTRSGFDILFAFPLHTLALNNGRLSEDNEGENSAREDLNLIESNSNKFMPTLERWWKKHKQPFTLPEHLPFAGGWFVYLGYELAAEIEPVLTLPSDESNFPDAFATRCPSAIIYDHRLKQTTLVTEYKYQGHLNRIQEDIAAYEIEVESESASFRHRCLISSFIEEEEYQFTAAVKLIKNYITEGDVFQVNLSRLWTATLNQNINEFDVYAALKYSNPSPFSGLAYTRHGSIISSSPERLISCKAGVIQTRPIAGTRPRDSEKQIDRALAEELMVHPKEIAEHIMLVDLERNDMGRVCIPGSIRVTDLMVRETYAKVHHIVSNIIGEIDHSISPIDVLKAVFPGGTITGCPKIRCMEIIAEMEKTGRGLYTGSMGYINYNGDMDFNILIRTFQLQENELLLRAGAGIVYDSNPENELEETRAKAAAMLDALGIDFI